MQQLNNSALESKDALPPASRRRAAPIAPSEEATRPNTEQRLYATRIKVYARSVQGFWRRVKWGVVATLLTLYYVAPWLRWNRGPDAPNQALLIDMPGRRAYFFGIEIWPQEIYYLTGMLILGAIGLFLATAWFGRVWCGFTCPQTVWTDLFMWVERKIEGDRNARIRLDKAPMSAGKIGRKAAKHVAWFLIALATGGAWIMYFYDAPTLVHHFVTGELSSTVYSFIFIFTMTTYVLAGWAREQVCIYMCPWPRFQSAMFDEDSAIVTYEAWRGEPRAPARKGQSFEARGDCVDCGMCWQVCPTGVDIRKGQQMACIGCGLCIDACNDIMQRFGRPAELITYDSINNQIARAESRPTRRRLIRPRTIAYMVLLAIIAAVMAYTLATRTRLDVSLLHDRQPLFVKLSDGGYRNGFTFKILNMEREPKTFLLATDGLPGGEITVIGIQPQPSPSVELTVMPDDIGTFRVFVKAPLSSLKGKSTDFRLVLTDLATRQMLVHNAVFNGPGE
ncbi:cytochrome c oxidase accessory protein CcoG [Defluviicoccus vanus]|uniref:Cytochrome c oxidase accessory protein CcoG n=1 Tax=Defluviicoccus vanus TaxID=111831 RepID=A0A7H1N6P4_9PROT|nr:cytochrome c oxidase accessory protein CcoG [Defluviicoccus vanus]QNT71380.1 cytochrome c oxidase accessory protein CcoG [Defluviicoccus vanus]